MAYRNLMIASNAQLKIKNEQLLIKTDTTHSVPIEDINSVLVENHQSTITIATLAKLVQDGVTIFCLRRKAYSLRYYDAFCAKCQTIRCC